ncbi:ATP-binding protein [Halanaerobacter jeridensis]|uniref:NAD-dependent dihydropyrimidine dehydrogenase PreA subunit n=1 Tax=Halanaerobacter jeridensis TaxID=706427 RepID=A0A939BM65_9FIRM|nr:4Fe-4S dicluster domain-containing protein [Halanaerobacter jeridensis]MBM7555710.1 NAD-dependent dihydropyrimidine dehydrogenase PreA subunit [Halanaerobacter jeridensis]
MKLKKFVELDSEKCNGCGECITTCNKGGIKIENGKARLVQSSFCGSFVNCIGDCPQGALKIESKKLSKAELENEITPNAGCYFSGRYDINQWVE